ncbi:hypothetical protein ACTXT7_000135 [Hymenolepis weldensis]
MTSHCLISIAVFQFVGGVVGVCSGIIRGVGMQRIGAVVCVGCMYLVGGPLGLSLLMLTDLGVSGFWWGLSVGMGAEAIVYVILILRIDWHKMCKKAARRTEIKFVTEAMKEIEIKFEPTKQVGYSDLATNKMKSLEQSSKHGWQTMRKVSSYDQSIDDVESSFVMRAFGIPGLLRNQDFNHGTDVGDEEISEEVGTESEEVVKACTTKLLLTRGIFVLFCISSVVAALLCRFFLNWRRHFQSYCHHVNNSLIPIDFANKSITSIYELQEDLPAKNKGRWGYYFPYGFWYEFKHLAALAIPIFIAFVIWTPDPSPLLTLLFVLLFPSIYNLVTLQTADSRSGVYR